MSFRIQVFPERCDGCRICEQICLMNHRQPNLSRIRILQASDHSFQVMVCDACEERECIKACDRGAIFVDELTGTPTVSRTLCNNCMKCVYVCKSSGLFYDLKYKQLIVCDTCNNGFFCALLCPNGALGRIKTSEPLKVAQDF
ncbi:MAG: hypothetical protein ACUVQ8_02880 [Nitrososphaeria archaeon]